MLVGWRFITGDGASILETVASLDGMVEETWEIGMALGACGGWVVV